MKIIRLSLLLFLACLFGCKEAIQPRITAISPLVNPPIPELAPPFEDRIIDAEEGAILSYETGSRVVIPPAALVTKAGDPVTSEVVIAFREYHDAASILLSGIPMSYDSGGVSTHFQTAGMFELRAFTQNSDSSLREKVFLEGGSLIQIKLASSEAEDNYNFYRLDEQARGWQFEGQRSPEVNVNRLEIKEKIISIEADSSWEINLGRSPFAFNYSGLLDVFFRENDVSIYRAMSTPEKSRKRVLNKAQAYGLTCLDFTVYEHIDWKGKRIPACMMAWDHLNDKEFPTWAKSYCKRKLTRFEDGVYQLVLSNGKVPDFVTWIRPIMPLRELFAFPPQNWAEQDEEIQRQIAAEEKRLAAETEVMRSFEIREFGIYNWDRFLKEEDPIRVMANFNFPTEMNELLSQPVVFFLPGDNRSVVKMPPYNWKQFAIVNDPKARILSILPGQRIALFTHQQYRDIDRDALRNQEKPSYTFAMQDLGKLQSQRQLMQMLGM